MKFCFKPCRRVMVKLKVPFCIITVIVFSVNLFMLLLQFNPMDRWLESMEKCLRFLEVPSSNDVNNFSFTFLNNLQEYMHNSNNNRTQKKRISLEDFWKGAMTGNYLIDDYGNNNRKETGEMGRGVILTIEERESQKASMSEYHVNTAVSDIIPMNRLVPDSRIKGCEKLKYDLHLPSSSIIIPFHNEWPSILLRTVYSIINRTPRHLLREIILVNDASTLDLLQGPPLNAYIENNFPEDLVRVLYVPTRVGLISARMRGAIEAKGDVLIIFDSHMEVNIDWLPPLLTEIVRDRKTVAMATLDYIQAASFEYKYNVNYLTRYGWEWRLVFFETFFRQGQIGLNTTNPRPGATMMGTAFAIEKKYFFDIGGYDERMTVWGGENLEMSWRVWMCGGKLIHVPCSRIGHIPRSQPYTFPGGRQQVIHYNYKRAISVWMGNYSRFVYHTYPSMKAIDVGDISNRLALKSNLNCKDFSWYLQNIWPELNVPDENVTVWGEVVNEDVGLCLDNAHYLLQSIGKLHFATCANNIQRQAFSLTKDSLLRTSLQCVVAHGPANGSEVKLQDCITGTRDRWNYLQDHSLVHLKSSLCMDIDKKIPVLRTCQQELKSQKWLFRPYTFTD